MMESNQQNSRHNGAGSGRRSESPAGTLATSRPCGILVVDDTACVRDMLSIGLRQEGFDVWLAGNGREAFNLYRRSRAVIDVVLLDVQMPEMNGAQTLAALQTLSPQIPCCFLSGFLDSDTEDALRNLGALAVLQKPISLDDLAHVLWQLSGKADGNCRSLRAPHESFTKETQEPMEIVRNHDH